MAFRHSCPNAGVSGSPRCRPDQPGKGPARCPGCGAEPWIEEGVYGVFRFDPTGRAYSEDDAIEWRQRETAAGVVADRMTRAAQVLEPAHRGYVVRFVRERLL
jgi:hypothetical protein